MNLKENKRPPKLLNLSGRATLAMTVKQFGECFDLEMALVIPGGGVQPMQKKILSSLKCENETKVWRAIRKIADDRLVGLAELLMEPPE